MKKIVALLLCVLMLVCGALVQVSAQNATELEETNAKSNYKIGDADLNGEISILDATVIQFHIAGITLLSADAMLVADTNGDNEVTIVDCTVVQRYVANIIDTFPAEENQNDKPQEPDGPTEYELEVLRLVNVEREKEGLKPLEFADFAYDCVRLRAQELFGLFSHTRPNGTPCYSVLSELGVDVPFVAYGENIARGYSTPAQVVNAWMNSQGHRENILNPDYTHLAVGAIEDSKFSSSYAWVQNFFEVV